jgi:hypothetical protein
MNTSEIRSKIAAYMEVGFTMSEAFEAIRNSKHMTKRSGDSIAAAVNNIVPNYDIRKYLH